MKTLCMKIGFIGLGGKNPGPEDQAFNIRTAGRRMGQNLQNAGNALVIYNRTEEKVHRLVEKGAK